MTRSGLDHRMVSLPSPHGTAVCPARPAADQC